MLRYPKTTDISTVNFPLSDGAQLLNLAAWRYCEEHMTDGRIHDPRTAHQLTKHTEKTVRLYVAELLAAGAWLPLRPKGFLIPDYLNFNWSREQILTYRATQSDKGKIGAAVRHGLPMPALRVVGSTPLPAPDEGWQRP